MAFTGRRTCMPRVHVHNVPSRRPGLKCSDDVYSLINTQSSVTFWLTRAMRASMQGSGFHRRYTRLALRPPSLYHDIRQSNRVFLQRMQPPFGIVYITHCVKRSEKCQNYTH